MRLRRSRTCRTIPNSSAKQQAFQEAQRAADEHRIEATRAERNARVEAEKRYGEAETEFDAAKANRDKVPATDTAGRALRKSAIRRPTTNSTRQTTTTTKRT